MKPSKYRSIKTVVNGHEFHSKKEAKRYQELALLEQSGVIQGLKLQPEFPCRIGNVLICKYRGDFLYVDPKTHKPTIEDVKGFKTPMYRLKKKIVLAIWGIEIKET